MNSKCGSRRASRRCSPTGPDPYRQGGKPAGSCLVVSGQAQGAKATTAIRSPGGNRILSPLVLSQNVRSQQLALQQAYPPRTSIKPVPHNGAASRPTHPRSRPIHRRNQVAASRHGAGRSAQVRPLSQQAATSPPAAEPLARREAANRPPNHRSRPKRRQRQAATSPLAAIGRRKTYASATTTYPAVAPTGSGVAAAICASIVANNLPAAISSRVCSGCKVAM